MRAGARMLEAHPLQICLRVASTKHRNLALLLLLLLLLLRLALMG